MNKGVPASPRAWEDVVQRDVFLVPAFMLGHACLGLVVVPEKTVWVLDSCDDPGRGETLGRQIIRCGIIVVIRLLGSIYAAAAPSRYVRNECGNTNEVNAGWTTMYFVFTVGSKSGYRMGSDTSILLPRHMELILNQGHSAAAFIKGIDKVRVARRLGLFIPNPSHLFLLDRISVLQ